MRLNSKDKRQELKKAIKRGVVIAPGVYDCIGAKIAEKTGFDALYLTGFGLSVSFLGMPDMGLVTLTELVSMAKNVNNITCLPLIVDCEGGFGNSINVIRVVEEMEKAGISAIQIEDQLNPKIYKSDGIPQVVDTDEHILKIKAAISARSDSDFLIIGRTDAYSRYGIDEAIKRAKSYMEAGADIIFIHGVHKKKDLEKIPEEVDAPNIINYSTIRESGIKRLPTVEELKNMGYKVIIFPGEPVFASAMAFNNLFKEIKGKGKACAQLKNLLSITRFKEIMDFKKCDDLEKKFLRGKKSEAAK